MRNYAPSTSPPNEGTTCAILNIELQKRTLSRHYGNYYAYGHRRRRTNNPELRIGRERERIGNIRFFIIRALAKVRNFTRCLSRMQIYLRDFF